MKNYFYNLIDPWSISIDDDPTPPWFHPDLNLDLDDMTLETEKMELPKGLTYKTEKLECNIKLISAKMIESEDDEEFDSFETEIEINIGEYKEVFTNSKEYSSSDYMMTTEEFEILDISTMEDPSGLREVLTDSFLDNIKKSLKEIGEISIVSLDEQFIWSSKSPYVDNDTGLVYNNESNKEQDLTSILPEGFISVDPLKKIEVTPTLEIPSFLNSVKTNLSNFDKKFKDISNRIQDSEYIEGASIPTEEEDVKNLKNKLFLKYFAIDTEGSLINSYDFVTGLKSSNSRKDNG